jgi:hypothetical protein
MIELVEGHWFNVDQIVSVKSIGKDKCILWTAGQPATEGHVLDYSAEDVVDSIESCYADEETVDGDEQEEEEQA